MSVVPRPPFHRTRTVAALRAHLRKDGVRWTPCRQVDEQIARLRAAKATIVGLEATGGYKTVVAASLPSACPARRARFRERVRQAGQDGLDRRRRHRPLRRDDQAGRATRQLGDLVARRSQIMAMMTAERQRESRNANRRLLESAERVLKTLQKELSDIEGQIQQSVRATPLWREKDNLLESVPRHRRPAHRRGARARHARPPPNRRPWRVSRLGSANRASGRVRASSVAAAALNTFYARLIGARKMQDGGVHRRRPKTADDTQRESRDSGGASAPALTRATGCSRREALLRFQPPHYAAARSAST